jgi:hypothetical protein
MSTLEVNKITPQGVATEVTLGDSGDTFTIPSGVTLTNNGTASGFGKIGQVIENNYTSNSTISSTSYIEVNSNLRLTATPNSSNSKFIYQFQAPVVCIGNEIGIFFALYKSTDGGSSFSSVRTDITEYFNYMTPAGNYYNHCSWQILDAPSTSNSIIYTVYAKVNSGTINVGNAGNVSAILMEVLE